MPTNIKVICYAGYRADEAPVYFYLGAQKIMVEDVIDRWNGENHRYFKINGDDGAGYTLRQDIEADVWELTMLESR